ncbi:MAG: hypothetical protein JWP97_2973 [Labilithrix sp.]|nr:hypothetical protein [Labilithrix sp.]
MQSSGGASAGERLTVPAGPQHSLAQIAARMRATFAAQDYFLAGYLTILLVASLFAPGPGRATALQLVSADVVGFAIGMTLTRGGILRQGGLAHGLVYRLSVLLPAFLSYFELRWILPAVSPHAVDGALLALDLRVFGVEPSLAWDRFVTPQTTEWFAFFYFSYFFLLSVHVLPMMLFSRNRARFAHFSLGLLGVVVLGQLLYMVVPGWGPYHHLAARFEHPLEGGLFWRMVRATVDGAGAQKDIFPSLHTAIPTFFTIFSFMHRRAWPFRVTWPVMAFTTVQIIGATMFLRWHYLIDIVAGLTLATASALISHRIVTWEAAHRRRRGVPPIFSRLAWPHGDPETGDASTP